MDANDEIALVTAEDVLRTLRGWVRTERQRLRWTQSELLRRSVVPAATISLFEYDASFLSRGLNPAPFKLPFRPSVQVSDHAGNMETFGLFEDSLPDG